MLFHDHTAPNISAEKARSGGVEAILAAVVILDVRIVSLAA